ncbi:MAG TPA: amino acid adenylation domain-containing protein [Streptosporangiaceae bacterium]|nr:amino acid adenylation domain-containing protein [Streptosporangiaceae bacterium]
MNDADVIATFRRHVATAGDRVAIATTDWSLSYQQADLVTDRIAGALRARGAADGRLVGLCLATSADFVLATLGALKAEAAVLPLEPSYPDDRLAYFYTDSRPALVIADAGTGGRGIWNESTELVTMAELTAGVPVNGAASTGSPARLAYIIYTSGSTGVPKGVRVTRGGLANSARGLAGGYGLTCDDRMLQFSSISFDSCMQEIFAPLSVGASIVCPAQASRQELIGKLADTLRATRTSVVTLPPALLRALPVRDLDCLRVIVSAGERCDAAVTARWAGRLTLVNAYGPTETAIGVSTHRCTPDETAPPIGAPYEGVVARVLDASMREVPEGTPGELYVGGAGVAQGYHGRPALTAQRFVPDPWGSDGARLYATGDQVCWRGGQLHYLGRIDRQVKVRGYRIEPAEVERMLERHPAVAAAAVVLRESSSALVGYLVPADGPAGAQSPDPRKIRQWLAERLPGYMVPSRLSWLDAMPLTVIGKVDYAALPEPNQPAAEATASFAGTDPLQARLGQLLISLLELEDIGLDEDFFDLGMHSLLATRFAAQVTRLMGVEVPVGLIFEAPSLRELVATLHQLTEAGRVTAQPLAADLAVAERPSRLPASGAQERIWANSQRRAGRQAYVSQVIAQITGVLAPDVLSQAIADVTERHEALRTTFALDSEGLVQIVHPASEPRPGLAVTAQAGPHADRERAVTDLAAAELPELRLDRLPLMRIAMMSFAPDDHALVITTHHIVTDGWSVAVLARDIAACYRARLRGTPAELPVLALQYPDYALRERRELEQAGSGLRWWRAELGDRPPVLEPPTDRPRPPAKSYRGGRVPVGIDADLAGALAARARDADATMFMVLLTGLAAVLSRYSGQDDLLIGTVLAGRRQPELADLIGCFVSPAVVRCDLTGDPTFATALSRARQRLLGIYAHQDVPLTVITDELGLGRGEDNPLLRVMLVLQNLPEPDLRLDDLGLRARITEVPAPTAKFDLSIVLATDGAGLSGSLEYDAELYDERTAARLAEHWLVMLRALAHRPDSRLSAVALLSDQDRASVLRWGGLAPYPAREDCLHQLFEQQARLWPGRVAVKAGERTCTYAELTRRACGIASLLRENGVRPGDVVGLRAERSAGLIAGLIAIGKCGAAYLPLDPRHPAGRHAYCLADAGARLVLTDGQPAAGTGLPEVDLTAAPECPHGDGCLSSEHQPPVAREPGDIAYVIYTSGSTGKPKGVAVSHRSAVTLLSAGSAALGLAPGGTWSMFHSIAFDFSVWEIWGALTTGGRVVMVPSDVARVPATFLGLLRDEQVTVLSQTPTAFDGLMQACADAGWPDLALGHVVFGGEALDPRALRPWFDAYGDQRPRLANMYGITETTVHVTWRFVTKRNALSGGRLIGAPLPHLRVRVLDRAGQLASPGVPGELYVGGAGLSEGYVGKAALTADRFVPDPFGPPGARLYRSGDRARWQPDGQLEYLGRLDDQVQVHGFRVELGEIEAQLLSLPGVRQAAVVPGEDRRITAHVAGALSEQAIRAQLTRLLPFYMIPARIESHDELPLSANGKADRKALLATAARQENPGACNGGLDAATPAQQALARVWHEVLGWAPASLTDSFFDLGGDSIGVIRVCALAAERGLVIDVDQFYLTPTIAALAEPASLAGSAGLAAPAPDGLPGYEPFSLTSEASRAGLPEDAVDAYPVSGMQQAMLYHYRMAGGSARFHNISSAHLRMPVDDGAFREALHGIIAAHPVLRTSFREVSGDLVQVVHRTVPLPLTRHDLRHLGTAEQEAELAEFLLAERGTPFDPAVAPLIRFTLHSRSSDSVQLTVTEHHAILDGWSVAAMMVEFFQRYSRAIDPALAPEPPAPPAALYAEYVRAEQAARAGGAARRYWAGVLEDAAPCLVARPHPAAGTDRLVTPIAHETRLSRAESDQLRQLARRSGAALRTVLLAAHLAAIGCYLGTDSVVTGVVQSGRLPSRDGDRVLGMFLNTIALPARLPRDSRGWDALIAAVEAAENAARPHIRCALADVLDGRPAPFDSAFNFTHFHIYGQLADIIEVLDRTEYQSTDLPLVANFSVDLDSDQILLRLDADPSRLPGLRLRALAGVYEVVLRAAAQERGSPGDPASLVPGEAVAALLAGGTGKPGQPAVTNLAREFGRLADDQPGRLAFAGPRPVTAGELAASATRIAASLRGRGVGAGDTVAVCLPRSPELAAAMLGILARGAVAQPLDPAHPEARRGRDITAGGARVVLAEAGERAFGELAVDVLTVPPVGQHHNGAAAESLTSSCPPAVQEIPGLPAFLLATSGSSGEAKQVVLSHGAVGNRLAWMWRQYPFDAGEVVAAKTSVAFCDFIWELFGALLRGVPVVPVSDAEVADPRRLAGVLREHRVTRIILVPTLLRAMLDACPDLGATLPALRWCTSSGEALSQDLAKTFLAAAPGVRLLNLYGSAEVAADVTGAEVTGQAGQDVRTMTVGRPIDNVRVLVVDPMLRLVPAGSPGQVCVAGASLASCYRGHAALTADRFRPCPHPAVPGERMYLTGDLGRWLPDGELELIGRTDNVMKVHGIRIDPAELESWLCRHPLVTSAAVAVRERAGEPVLVAYVTDGDGPGTGNAAGAGVDLAEVRRHLRPWIPPSWLPDAVVPLAELPRTASGKVDRNALPGLQGHRTANPAGAVSRPGGTPRTRTQRTILGAWRDVLGTEAGIFDDFFDLGGNSVLAMRAVMRVETLCGVRLDVAQLFQTPTAAELAAHIDAIGTARPARDLEFPAAGYDPEAAPLSHPQQRLWFLDQLEPGSPAYVMPAVLRLAGPLDRGRLARALDYVANRHEALHCRFGARDGTPFQRVGPGSRVPVELAELAGNGHAAPLDRAMALVREFGTRPFDLTSGPLLRALLIALAADDHVLTLCVHHIAADGWSLQVMAAELLTAYEAYGTGKEPGLAAPAVQYPAYAAWQARHRDSQDLQARLGQLARRLTPAPPPLALPADLPARQLRGYAGAAITSRLDPAASNALRALGRRHRCTTFMVTLAGFAVLLHRYCDETDLAIGTPIANRPHPALADAVGFFANTHVLRVDTSGEPTFTELLDRVRTVTLEAHDSQDVPFELLVDRLQPERDLGANPLFSVMFELAEGWRPAAAAELAVTPLPADFGIAKFDLTLHVDDEPAGLLLLLEYSTDLFLPGTAERLLGDYERLLLAAAASPDVAIDALAMAGEAELELIRAANATCRDWPAASYAELFARLAATGGTAVACAGEAGEAGEVGEAGDVTYRQLASQAGAVAAALKSAGAGRADIVMVRMARGPALLASVVGLIAAGAVYLPVDPAEPVARTARLIAGATPAVVITDRENLAATRDALAQAPATAGTATAGTATAGTATAGTAAAGTATAGIAAAGIAAHLPVLMAEDVLGQPDPPALTVTPVHGNDPAYVLFTSGSTGEPKPVVVPHSAFLNHIHAMVAALDLRPGDVLAQTAPVCFDISVWQLLAPLAFGGTVRIVRDVTATDPAALCDLLETTRIDVLELVPAMATALVGWMERTGQRPLAVRWLIATGEVVPADPCRRWLGLVPGSSVVNAYGPAECADDVSLHIARHIPAGLARLPIGRPVAGAALHVVDSRLREVPVGVTGELCVSGAAVGLGYLGQPSATARAFVPDPFGQEPGARMYRTGDLGRRLADGSIDLSGRKDQQVKVGGSRIELGEVEAAAAEIDGVTGAVAVVRAGLLVAYIEGTADPGAVRGALRLLLPARMVPARVVACAALPRTRSGKVDRDALPEPPPPGPAEQAPMTTEEHQLAGIWDEVLGHRNFGRCDDFFAVGGHSLLAVRVQARILESFGIRVPLRLIFSAPTIGELAAAVIAEEIAQSQADDLAWALAELRGPTTDT